MREKGKDWRLLGEDLGHPTKRGILFQLIFGILLILGFGAFIGFTFTQVNLETEIDAFMTLGMALMGSLLGAIAVMAGVALIIRGIIDLICFIKKVDCID